MTFQTGDKVKTTTGITGTVVKVKGCYLTIETWTQTFGQPKLMQLEFKAKFCEAA